MGSRLLTLPDAGTSAYKLLGRKLLLLLLRHSRGNVVSGLEVLGRLVDVGVVDAQGPEEAVADPDQPAADTGEPLAGPRLADVGKRLRLAGHEGVELSLQLVNFAGQLRLDMHPHCVSLIYQQRIAVLRRCKPWVQVLTRVGGQSPVLRCWPSGGPFKLTSHASSSASSDLQMEARY